MKIFEFQFNPKAKKDRFLKVFSFEPQEKEHEAQGNMYIVGQLDKALPVNSSFLQRLAAVIQAGYFSSHTSLSERGRKKGKSADASLKAALKKANEFLSEETKQGNVDWLGNLQFAVLVFVPNSSGHTLYFTKVGSIKVWMARNGSLVDVGKSIEEKQRDDVSGKVFGNVGSGKVVEEDKIFVLTEDLFQIFAKENLLQSIARMRDEKEYRKLFKSKEKDLSTVSGLLFFVAMEVLREEEGEPSGKRVEMPKIPSLPLPRSLPAFPTVRSLPALPSVSIKNFPRPSLEKLPIKKIPFPRFAQVSVPGSVKQRIPSFAVSAYRQRVILLLLLAFILFLGFALFGTEHGISKEVQQKLDQAHAPVQEATTAETFRDDQRANEVLQQAWSLVVPYTEKENVANNKAREEFTMLQQEIEQRLIPLNKIEDIESPEIFIRLDRSKTKEVPQYMLFAGTTFYFFNSSSPELYVFDSKTQEDSVIQLGRNASSGTTFPDSVSLFSPPNTLLELDGQGDVTEHTLSFPTTDFRPMGIEGFAGSLYAFDARTGEILKSSGKDADQLPMAVWLDRLSPKKPINATAITIDGNIWVSINTGEIQRYFKGKYQETLSPTIFPALKGATIIRTASQLSHLYILDPAENRLIVLSKFGDVMKQYRSAMFAGALDFAISPNGQTAYIFNGHNIFRISGIEIEPQ